MPNTTTASAEARFTRSRWAAATAASSARSAGEYGAGAFAPGNGVARCPAGPCAGLASRYSADRYVPRVETPGRAGRSRRTPRSRHSRAGTPGRPGLPGQQRTGTARAAPGRPWPAAAARRTAGLRCRRPSLPSRGSHQASLLKRIRLKARRAGGAPASGRPRAADVRDPGQWRSDANPSPAQTRPGPRSRRPSARSASPCPAASPSAAPAAAGPAAPARPARRPCTAPTPSGPAPSTADRHPDPHPGPEPRLRPWFAGARRLRQLTAELEAVSLAEMARAEGWAKITPGTPAPTRTGPPGYPEPAQNTQNAGRSARLTRETAPRRTP